MNIEELKNIFGDCELTEDKIIIKSNLKKTLDFVKQNYGFDLLKEIIAVDNKENGIELTYHLFSTEDEEDVLIAVNVKDEAESVSEIFDSAVADEKEIYDLFGVKFIGNEELKRLYMPEDWDGHPLKKDN
ncbi:MAG: NADH-quinone oxidoreductase subunit C [Candidatus Gastranaerophilales bacterium]|nr:NADH-quinone oxidoreductase subunit C [Candidatus Gastranaerophilales bacterium]MCM1073145.1 NADH-quinone oxidoreductase subunit C [Bacteroides sp.]